MEEEEEETILPPTETMNEDQDEDQDEDRYHIQFCTHIFFVSYFTN
jgi:hypothetical protein